MADLQAALSEAVKLNRSISQFLKFSTCTQGGRLGLQVRRAVPAPPASTSSTSAPLFSKKCEEEYRKALKETGVEISSFIVVHRWSGPTEEQRRHAVANWKRIIQVAGDMGVPPSTPSSPGTPTSRKSATACSSAPWRNCSPSLSGRGCRYILPPPWLNARGRADVSVHQHTAMGEGEVDFDGIFETLRETDFVNKQQRPDAKSYEELPLFLNATFSLKCQRPSAQSPRTPGRPWRSSPPPFSGHTPA